MKPQISNILLFVYIGVLPVQIDTTSKDSTETNFRVTGGFGQYAHISRGCEGNVLDKEDIPFSELGASIDHKTKTPFRFGLNADYIFTKRERELDNYYRNGNYYGQRYSGNKSSKEIFTVNPNINAEWKYFALGGGYLWASRPIIDSDDDSGEHLGSGYIRIGNIRSFYFDASVFHTTPIFSESCFKLGLGFRSNPNVGWWFGFGAEPYDKGGLIMKTNVRIQPHLYLDTLIRIGSSEGVSESAVSLGLTYKSIGGK